MLQVKRIAVLAEEGFKEAEFSEPLRTRWSGTEILLPLVNRLTGRDLTGQ